MSTLKPNLLDEDYLKSNTPIPENVSWDNIEWSVLEAQDMKIEHKTGTELLDEIYALVNAKTLYSSGNTKYATLVDEYVKPALKWSALYFASMHLWAKPTNQTVAKGTSDYQIPLDNGEFIYWRNTYRKWMNERLDRLYNFLMANTDTYPSFLNGNTDQDDILPDDQDDWGIVFDED